MQDPLSFRVAPQVHGAFRDVLTFAGEAVGTELNAQADNPLVSPVDGTLVSNGNFHPVLLAVAFDAVRVAIAHVGQLVDRRLGHLWSAFFEAMAGGPPMDEPPPDLPGMHLRYPAAAAYGELRQLASPVSLDIGVLDQGVEDHATAAPLSVQKTDEALDRLLDLRPSRPQLGEGTGALYASARGATAGLPEGSPDDVHAVLRDVVLPPSARSRRT